MSENWDNRDFDEHREEQTVLFDEEQEEQLERVSARIARPIIQFCKEHGRFHADELRRYVVSQIGVTAPGSADRVLRDLRQQKRLNYRVISRRESLYETIEVKG